MSTTGTFDDFYKKLPTEEKQKLLNHIIETKLPISLEGLYAGPTGSLTKGLYAGPSGLAPQKVCEHCGK